MQVTSTGFTTEGSVASLDLVRRVPAAAEGFGALRSEHVVASSPTEIGSLSGEARAGRHTEKGGSGIVGTGVKSTGSKGG